MKPLLEVSHLDKQIGTLHLQDISFALEPGYIFGLIGRNGSGKTSLLRTILNLYRKDSGAVSVNGCPMDSMEHEAKDQIGFVLDEFIFEERLSISANGRYFGSTYSKYDHSLFLQFCERFHLDPKQKTGRLSKGQKTRFQLAFALSHQAKLAYHGRTCRGTGSALPPGAYRLYAGACGGRHTERSLFHASDSGPGSDRRLYRTDR